jgi:hypothetical protein
MAFPKRGTGLTKINAMGRRVWLLSGFALWALTLGAPTSAQADGEALVVVTSADSPIQDLSLTELRRIYMGGDLRAKDGSRILALNRGHKTAERVEFDRVVLRMSPDRVAQYWIDRRIRGQSGSPKAVDPAPIVQKVVSRLQGSIGYVKASDVSDNVRVIPIGGRNPDDSDYPLR